MEEVGIFGCVLAAYFMLLKVHRVPIQVETVEGYNVFKCCIVMLPAFTILQCMIMQSVLGNVNFFHNEKL